MKKIIIILVIILSVLFITIPCIEVIEEDKIFFISYGYYNVEELESCFDDSYFYDSKKDRTIYESKEVDYFFFRTYTLTYESGNKCTVRKDNTWEKEFLENAIIFDNPNNIDIKELIKNKKLVSQEKVIIDSDENILYYTINDQVYVLYYEINNDELFIQVGYSDESPLYFTYK